MANKIECMSGWQFTKSAVEVKPGASVLNGNDFEPVELPHTWNGTDGQDGGNDYYRGTCFYARKLTKSELPEGEKIYIEFEGTNSSATLYVNGTEAASHDGGYSTWRADITELLGDDNEIVVAVDNSPNDRVYPQMADFTFYGGIYRKVSLIGAGETRFDLDYYGGPALKITPEVTGADAKITAKSYVTNAKDGQTVEYVITDAEGADVASASAPAANAEAELAIEGVHLWNGRKDPYLYTMTAELKDGDAVLDTRTSRFGCRTYEIDPEKGFILNGESYPLHGVSRHQDRPGIGNALKPEHHEEDIDLICEMGATTIRLAHYQHDQYFYNLCDERGLVIWAEIPYISRHLPNGRANTISQMTELIVQNYNHPCIVVWGLSNEITMGGASDPDLIDNHKVLNDLCHELDKTRLTTMAVVTMCDMNEEYVQIPDVVSYNHYYGWYGGDTSMNGEFFDKFHETFPDKPVGMSEYGCEALNWHTSNPTQGDYTEEYQAYYHEELIKQLYTRPFIWATHVWNMFDFAADARAEGGEDGMNHKGLVTFDRKYKKDSFYAYKAWLSDEPFVHICSKRYVDRVEDVTRVTVYSNQPEVELFVKGESIGKQEAPQHFFYFEVKNEGESAIVAKAGDCTDESTIRKVSEPNPDYIMDEGGDVLNWFEIDMPDGYLSINNTIGDVLATTRGKIVMLGLVKKLMGGSGKGKGDGKAMGFELNDDMKRMLYGFTVKRALSMTATAGLDVKITKEDMLKLNKKLNKIKVKS